MARSIQDIDLGPLVHDGSVLCQDCDSAFPFLIIGVHDPFLYLFVGTEDMALFQHGIDKGSLAMVDVGNDSNVTQIVSNHKSLSPLEINQEDACQKHPHCNQKFLTTLLYAIPVMLSIDTL